MNHEMSHEIEEIKNRLRATRISFVAKQMGVSQTLLYNLMHGKTKRITTKTYNKIMNYLNKWD